jgi:putative transferase (TIGR04331 family)
VVKKLLITTAIEQSWGDKKNVIFLGEWCRLDGRKNVWEKLGNDVCTYHWDDRKKVLNDYNYIQEVYERLLAELALKLNSIHEIDLSVRAWRILVGPWLGYFLQMLFDRWYMIQSALESENQLKTIVLTGQELSMIPNDMDHFFNLFLADDWNHFIYRCILERESSVERIELPYNRIIEGAQRSQDRSFKSILKRRIKSIYNKLASFINGQNGALFINTYLSWKDDLILSSRYKQLPILQHTDQPPIAEVNFEKRRWTMSVQGCTAFEVLAKSLIPQQIPIAYLEGFKSGLNKSSTMGWPSKPSLMFTSNAFSSDDIFKIYAALKVGRGAKLVIGQHGGHYGIGKWFFNEKHEIAISDKFLSWGWTDSLQPKVRRVGQLKAKSPLNIRHGEQPRLLLVTATLPRYSYFLYSIVISSQWLHYFQDQCEFVGKLDSSIRDALTIRLYKNDFGWNQLKRWKDRFPALNYDEGNQDINTHIRECRIFVSTYNATTYLESFSMDIPTVIYWDPNFTELRESAIPFFEELKRVGIFHETPDSAADHINKIWVDVGSWWYSAEVSAVVLNFKDAFCHLSEQLVDDIEREFKTLISEN